MTKTISCFNCGECIQIEGQSEGSGEVAQPVTCPYCEILNEVMWPMGAGYIVGPCEREKAK